MKTIGFSEVLISLFLVLFSILISRYWKIPVVKDLAIGSVRAFVQLVAIGFALQYIFDLESGLLIIATLLIMIAVGAQSASSNVKHLKGAFWITFIAMITATALTLSFIILLDIIEFKARWVIPLSGMIIGNSMNSAALTCERLSSEIKNNKSAIETALSLGKSWRVAALPYQKKSAVAGMLSILNFLKTVGIVALPGAMTGMILAGADPLEAVLLQIMVGYMLVSAVTITSIVTLELTIHRFFNRNHQLEI